MSLPSQSSESSPVFALVPHDPRTFSTIPVQYPDLWELYKQQERSIWFSEELSLAKDRAQWMKLDLRIQHFIKYILGFFAGADGVVFDNLGERFLKEVPIPEAARFYMLQGVMEGVHSDTYIQLLDTYIEDPAEKQVLFNAIETMPPVKKKADWALRWAHADAPLPMRLLAFACVEGIFFSGSFCAIFWLKVHMQNQLEGLIQSNEFISRDEGMHTDFACRLYTRYVRAVHKVPVEDVHALFREAVSIETEFITEAVPCELIGMNGRLMTQYIQYVADRLLQQLEYPILFGAENPFAFMEHASLEAKTNFFEHKVTQYVKAPALVQLTDEAFHV